MTSAIKFSLFIGLGLLLFLKCSVAAPFSIEISQIPTPTENPITKEKIALGRQLFFDKSLSLNETVSCATCHVPEYAFTDRKKTSEGILGRTTTRNSPSILNAAFLKTVMFDAHLPSLEMQVIVPIQEHTEMGHNMKDLIQKLRNIPEYQAEAKKIFNRDFDAYVLTRSISAFERSLVSLNSRYDQYMRGDKTILTMNEKAGMKLFTDKLYCIQCHPPPYFTTFDAKNNGLYKEFGEDKGRFRIYLDSADIGKFKVPSLRNIELTYPYMHDGSMNTIDEIINHYKKGGQGNHLQDKTIHPFELNSKEQEQLKAFLFSLTDTSYLQENNFNQRN
ncbi:MAG: cytochrome-c peroxidase [Crocinitomicaceae bacterium]|nr:cytochrome-c peroxidase [Crocinitomicaceae bacterium]